MITAIALWLCALGCGLIAGLYFAFSTFIMTALGRIEAVQGIAAMNAINSTILRSLFMPLFFGTTLVSLALGVLALLRFGQPGTAAMLAGGLLYVVGMFIVTMVANVPLNNALAAIEPGGSQTASVWAHYLDKWTFWNHVRTVASIAASACFIVALIAQHRS
jgi:uncharacterized membrane protein